MKKLLALLVALTMLLGCVAVAEETTVEALAYDSLTVGLLTPMTGAFFTDMWGSNSADMDIRNLLHGYNMMQWDSENGTYGINPTVVSGINVTEDAVGNRTYQVALYHDLTYSDGTPITAWDYAFTLLLYASPEIEEIGGGTGALDYVMGMADYRGGEADTISGVNVVNDYLMNITISADYRPYFYELAVLNVNPYPISVIAPGCEVADDGNGVYIRNEDANVTEPVFTAELLQKTILDPENGYLSHPQVVSGPYVMTSYDAANGTATFEINSNYKGNADGVVPSIQNIKVVTVTNATLLDQLQSGEIGLVNHVVNADTIASGMEMTADPAYSVSNYTRSGFTFISMNCERPTVSDQAVRQAMAMAFDKDTFVAEMVGNYGIRVEGYYGIGQWMYQMINGTIVAEDADEWDADTQAAWDELSMDSLTTYAFDTDAAAALLEQNGWVIGESGLREKDGVVLDLTLLAVEDSEAIEPLQTCFVDNLAKIGIKVTIETASAEKMLSLYYRQSERSNDMFYMASNFSTVFDPGVNFATADSAQGVDNRTGIRDEQLAELAAAINVTEPGDTLSYCQKWLAFQQRYSEVLPSIPVYSNVYFDFYTSTLHNYNITEGQTWSDAIVGAWLGDYADEETEEGEEVFE